LPQLTACRPAGRRPRRDLQREDQFERRVDRSLFIEAEPACVSIEPIQVHRAQLLDEHARRFALDLDGKRTPKMSPRVTLASTSSASSERRRLRRPASMSAVRTACSTDYLGARMALLGLSRRTPRG